MENKELVNKAFALKDKRRKAIKEGNIELAESLLKEYQDVMSKMPKDLVFAVGVY